MGDAIRLVGAAIAALVLAAIVVLFAAIMVEVMGYVLGLWSAPCAIDASQPHCIAAGWGKHLDVVVRH